MNAVSRIRKSTKVKFRPVDGPTLERLAKADGHFVLGDDGQGGRRHTMRDTPLDRMYARQAIGGVEYSALDKFRRHWHHAGLEHGVASVDPNRIFTSDPSTRHGMAMGERQVWHQQEIRNARAELGHRPAIVVENVVCNEWTLEIAGMSIGWKSKPQAIAAITEILKDAGSRLARHWGMVGKR